MKEEEKSVPQEESHNQLVSFLLRLAGSRPAIPVAVTERVHSQVHAHWQQTIRRRKYRRWVLSLASPIAALFCFYLVALHLLALRLPSSIAVGFVENLNGNATVTQKETVAPLVKNSMLMTGTVLQTDNASRLLCHILGGGMFRLDVNSRLYLKSDTSMVLDRGAIYIDSAKAQSRLAVLTNLGTVHDVGTQFEVRVNEGSIRIRVREGSISLLRNGYSKAAGEGTELAVDHNGNASIRTISKYGSQWNWISEVAPAFRIEGEPLMEFLKWVTRENGWILKFADPRIEKNASHVILHGSISGLSPAETPEVVLPVCGLRFTIVNGVMTVQSARNEPVR